MPYDMNPYILAGAAALLCLLAAVGVFFALKAHKTRRGSSKETAQSVSSLPQADTVPPVFHASAQSTQLVPEDTTAALSADDLSQGAPPCFEIEYEITHIHTDEII